VQAGDLNKTYDILVTTQEYLNVLEILHKTILDIRHYRG